MESIIKSDLIYQDKSLEFCESVKYINGNCLDTETKEYYLSIIRVKNILENIFTPRERFLFTKYFAGYSLKEIRSFGSAAEHDLPKSPARLKRIFADACYKFIIKLKIYPDITSDKLTYILAQLHFCYIYKIKQPHPAGKIYREFLKIDTYKKNSSQTGIDKKESRLYFEVYINYVFYLDFLQKAKRNTGQISP